MKSKSLVLLALVLALALALVSCGSKDQTTTQSSAPSSPEQTSTTTTTVSETTTNASETTTGSETTTTAAAAGGTTSADIMSPVQLKDCTFVITEVKLVPGANEGKYALRLTYDVTNNKQEDDMPLGLFSKKAFQNGIEIETVLYNKRIDSSKAIKEMRPGATMKGIQMGFELEDMSEVELEISDYFNFENEKKVLFKINPESLEKEE